MYRVAVWTGYFRILSVYVHNSITDEIPGGKKPMEIMPHSVEMQETVDIKCYHSSVIDSITYGHGLGNSYI